MRFRIVRKPGLIRVETEKGHFNLVRWEGKPRDFGLERLPLPERIRLYEIQEFMPYGTMHDDEIKRRTGLGEKSIDHAIVLAKKDGAHVLAVTTDNPRLEKILMKKGFKRVMERVYVKLLNSRIQT